MTALPTRFVKVILPRDAQFVVDSPVRDGPEAKSVGVGLPVVEGATGHSHPVGKSVFVNVAEVVLVIHLVHVGVRITRIDAHETCFPTKPLDVQEVLHQPPRVNVILAQLAADLIPLLRL